jgi:hypothetical protein
MLGDAQWELHYIMIDVYIIIGDIEEATVGNEINDVHRHINGSMMTRNSWNC